MTRVLTFGNFKGGTGKTTNATMTGLELANRGYKTLLVDLDPQGNATNLYLKTKQNIDNEIVSFDKTLMTGIKDKNLKETLITIKDNLDILPSSADFSSYQYYMESVNSEYEERVKYFSQLLEEVKNDYDWVIIDIPPTISLITDSALYASDYCLVVLQTQERSLQGAEAFVKYIQDTVINTFNAPTLEVLGILPVLLKNSAPIDMNTIESAKEIFGEENIFSSLVRNMERLKRYDVTGVTFDHMHDKRVQQVYSEVADELILRIKESE